MSCAGGIDVGETYMELARMTLASSSCNAFFLFRISESMVCYCCLEIMEYRRGINVSMSKIRIRVSLDGCRGFTGKMKG